MERLRLFQKYRGVVFVRSFFHFNHSSAFSTLAKPVDYTLGEYQFLHKSEIPTYHFQKSLRRLPIPKLEETCRRYLNAVQAVYGVNSLDFENAKKTIGQFIAGDGPELQKALLAYDKQNPHTSYISEPWFDIYLKSRVPCPINYNPFIMFAPDADPQYNNQLVRSTNFVLAFGRFKKALKAEVLAPEVFHLNPKKSDTNFFRRVCRTLPSNLSWFGAVAFKAFPLDMSQYPSLFGGCRIPQKGNDRLHLNQNSRHFLVIRNGVFYTINLFDENYNLLQPDIVHSCLAKILQESNSGSSVGVGSLTTLERDAWAEARAEMLALNGNRDALRFVDDALFALCLDEKIDDLPVKLKAGADHSKLVNSLLCGGDGSNRWFDKCFQLIVDGHGMATINFEHSWGDGVAVLRLMEESLRDTTQNRFVTVQDTVDFSKVGNNLKKIEWSLNDSISIKIEGAKVKHLAQGNKLQFSTTEYFSMNRNIIKSYQLSPDSVMQLAIQLAFYRTYKEFVPTYESCSTAAFLKGRTECVRSATLSTRATVLALEKGSVTLIELRNFLRECSKVHSDLIKEASMGQGFDRHLLGLKITAERLQKPVPELFNDSVYKRMGNFVLSTSTLSTDTIVFGGFGPVVADGFGIGYNVVDSKLGAVISSFKDKRNAQEFSDALTVSLDILHGVLKKTNND